MARSPTMQKFVDNFAKSVFGRSHTESAKMAVCVCCGTPIDFSDFRDTLSIKEYKLSDMCMQCQNSVFGID